MSVLSTMAGEGLVDAGDESFVVGAMLEPDGVEMSGLGEGAEERQDVHDLGGVGEARSRRRWG